jgi:ribosomal protein S18 acetylase RimI-like enzyme
MADLIAGFRLRDASLSDAEGMARVGRNAWMFAYAGILPDDFIASVTDLHLSIERFQRSLTQPGHRLVAVSREGTLIGYAIQRAPCSLDEYDGEICGLYVDPESSRAGVGRALVEAMVARFKSDGYRSMAIHTLAQNRIGCAFHEKLGGGEGPSSTWHECPSKWYVWPDLASFPSVASQVIDSEACF